MSDRHEMQAAGTHPAPCARHCESTAYEIEIRRLRAELAASREREARMRAMIADDGHAMTFQSLGQYRTSLLRALAEGARGADALIDCRTCRNYTRDGCIQTAQCVNGDGYRRATPVRFWSAALAEGAQEPVHRPVHQPVHGELNNEA